MRLTINHGLRRYTVLIVGIGIAGVAIGWFRPDSILPGTHTARSADRA